MAPPPRCLNYSGSSDSIRCTLLRHHHGPCSFGEAPGDPTPKSTKPEDEWTEHDERRWTEQQRASERCTATVNGIWGKRQCILKSHKRGPHMYDEVELIQPETKSLKERTTELNAALQRRHDREHMTPRDESTETHASEELRATPGLCTSTDKHEHKCYRLRGHRGQHIFQAPINRYNPSELTTAGTIRVKNITGCLVGDTVPVIINGQTYPSKVVKVTATTVEVEPQVPNLVALVTGYDEAEDPILASMPDTDEEAPLSELIAEPKERCRVRIEYGHQCTLNRGHKGGHDRYNGPHGKAHLPVTDPELDAPDGARLSGYERIGDQWVRIKPTETKEPDSIKALTTGDVTTSELADITCIASSFPLHVIIQAAMERAKLNGMRLKMSLGRPKKKTTLKKKKGRG